MRIQCPSCAATYEVPETILDRPRTVRCAQCGEDWMAVAIAQPEMPEPDPQFPAAESEVPSQKPAALAVVTPLPEAEVVSITMPLSAIERLAMAGPRIRRRDHLLTTAWAASFAALAALGVAGYTQRDMLMRQWPASVRVYSVLGMAPLATHARDPAPAR